MFPLLALALAYAARVGVAHYQPVFVLCAWPVPVLSSLVLIRFFARVLATAFRARRPCGWSSA